MRQKEFIEMIKIMLKTREIQLSEGERKDSIEIIENIDKTLKEYYKSYIISEITSDDCCNPSECGYDSWYCFFGDTDGPITEEYIRELFTEDECEEIWLSSHKS